MQELLHGYDITTSFSGPKKLHGGLLNGRLEFQVPDLASLFNKNSLSLEVNHQRGRISKFFLILQERMMKTSQE